MTEPSRALYLAIDQGGQSTRAFVFDSHGVVIAEGVESCAVSHPQPHWVEQDADNVVGSVTRALAHIRHKLGPRCRDIAAAGLATQRSSIVCWDRRNGVPLSPVISWQDTRAHQWLNGFTAHEGDIRRITGLQLSAHYGVSKLRWCLDQMKSVSAAQAAGTLAWGPLASFLVFRLLVERPQLVDPANAARTLLWDLHQRDWSADLLSLFGLPREPLPRCTPSRHAFGTLHLDGCEIPLGVVTGDQSAALFAFGEPRTDTAYVNIGTGAFVQRLSHHYPADVGQLLAGVVLHDGDELTYALEGTVNGAASALRWFECERGVQDIEATLPAWLARADVPPLFLNGIAGLGSPYWVADFPTRFVGDGKTWMKAVAVVESIAFLLQVNIERMQELGSPPQQLQVSGGLARLDGLCQRLADLSGLRVYRPAQSEATARGTAYLAAGRPVTWRKPGHGRWFRPQTNTALGQRFHAWCEAMDASLKALR
jgi:glycerol kinase